MMDVWDPIRAWKLTHDFWLCLRRKRTIFLNLTYANFKNSLNSGQFADLNSPNLGFLDKFSQNIIKTKKSFYNFFLGDRRGWG